MIGDDIINEEEMMKMILSILQFTHLLIYHHQMKKTVTMKLKERILKEPKLKQPRIIEDKLCDLTPVNPVNGQQHDVICIIWLHLSNMLNPNQDTGVDDIFGQHTEATSLIDTPVTAIMEPSFTAQTNRPPTSTYSRLHKLNNHQF
ncbi:hypothetical protein Tco_0222762 [Tanacetum coccineum]